LLQRIGNPTDIGIYEIGFNGRWGKNHICLVPVECRYSIDYDLRLFSYDRFDEDTEVLSGVGTLQGISIEMRKINLSMEDVITDLKQAMEQPVCETVPIGADSALAVLVRDAAEEASVRNFNYLVSQDDSCLLISTSNTMYSYIDAPVVPEADAAIDATVKTLKIDR